MVGNSRINIHRTWYPLLASSPVLPNYANKVSAPVVFCVSRASLGFYLLITDGADDCKDWPRHWLAHSVYRNVLSKPSLINPPKMLVWPGLPISSIESHTPMDGEEPRMDINLCISVTHARTITTPSLPPLFRTFRPLGRWQSPLLLLLLCQAAFRMCFLPALRFLKARAHFSFPGCATCILRTQLMHKIPCQRL